MNRIAFAAAFLLLFPIQSFSQPYRACGTTEMHNQLLQSDPDYAFRRMIIENAARIYMANQPEKKNTGASVLYIVPVVFHIIHDYGIENISRAQVLDGVRLINESFQKKSPDTADVIPAFQSIFANCEIEFRLAQIDPNGNCTDGITRTRSTQTYSADDNVKNLIRWPNQSYLNIWVVNNIASGAAGYAYYPGASPQIDGIVIRHDYMASIGTAPGSTYNARALTHEIGHYLDLPHTWGSTNNPGLASNCNLDDGIQDTPNTIGVSNFSCNTSQATCGSLDNVQNYMDYGSCPKMFTEGQKDRMHFTLNMQRMFLADPANNVATGTDDAFVPSPCAPVADFSDRVKYICTGQQVQFKDVSWKGIPDSWSWSFPGGSPAFSTDTNPTITYNTPGIYDVSLTVSNPGGSNTLTRTAHVVVSSAVPNHTLPYSEDFENIVFPGSNNHWLVFNSSGTAGWQLTSQAAFSGTQSLFLNNFNGNPSGQSDDFVTPSFDFSNVTNASLTFRMAFARKSSSSTDSLKVFASKDCGATWSLRFNKFGSNLATNSGTALQPFVPQSQADWRLETVNMASPSFNNQPNIRFRFHYYQSAGNNLYIDDINLNGILGTDQPFTRTVSLIAYPNPAQSEFYLSFLLNSPSSVKIDLLELSGKLINNMADTRLDAGEHLVRMTNPVSPGVYLLRFITDEGTAYQKVVFTEKQ